jgi:SPX domain protein involved in polyphosphate accumulation
MKTDLTHSNFFSYVEKHTEDDITKLRHEIKFEYINTDISKIDTILGINCQRVIHASEESMVNSIYFDDFTLTSLRQNLDGIGMRIKLRLRWYDAELPGKTAFFEIKRRTNTIVKKERYAIISRRPVNRMTYPEIIKELLRVLPETPRELLRMRQQPVVLIRYRRKHYKARDARLPIRITLDQNIEGYEQIGMKLPVTKFKVPLYDKIVLEAKSVIGNEKNIPKLLYPLRPRQSRFSKYVLTCSQLGLITGLNEQFI